MRLSNCVALGVGDPREAADYYELALGFERIKLEKHWVEMRSGPMRLFLCDDQVNEPTFELLVDNLDEAVERLTSLGFEEVDLEGASDDVFMRDRYGYLFCVSPA